MLSTIRLSDCRSTESDTLESDNNFLVEDIELEIKAIADIIIDHGLRKYHFYRQSSTLLNVETFEVVRHGSNFEIIADICRRRFGVTLAEPMGL